MNKNYLKYNELKNVLKKIVKLFMNIPNDNHIN